MKSLRKYAANNVVKNTSFRLRAKRIRTFDKLLRNLKRDNLKILDIGGESGFWEFWQEYLTDRIDITLVNISREKIKGNNGILGDALNLDFIRDNKFDVAFSNSLIEHLFTFENQRVFAKEIKRIADYYFIQTPAFLFPLEPHFLFPSFHWLPEGMRIKLHQKFNLGWYRAESDYIKAKKNIGEIRIMKKRELVSLFPEGETIVEKFLLFPKSYIITNLKMY